jgi:hypothetical protein
MVTERGGAACPLRYRRSTPILPQKAGLSGGRQRILEVWPKTVALRPLFNESGHSLAILMALCSEALLLKATNRKTIAQNEDLPEYRTR